MKRFFTALGRALRIFNFGLFVTIGMIIWFLWLPLYAVTRLCADLPQELQLGVAFAAVIGWVIFNAILIREFENV